MTKRLISFSDPQYKALRARAEELGLPVSELVRRIVDAYLAAQTQPPQLDGVEDETR